MLSGVISGSVAVGCAVAVELDGKMSISFQAG